MRAACDTAAGAGSYVATLSSIGRSYHCPERLLQTGVPESRTRTPPQTCADRASLSGTSIRAVETRHAL